MRKSEAERKEAKRVAVLYWLDEFYPHRDVLTGMLDEEKLDAIILAFGLGHVTLNEDK